MQPIGKTKPSTLPDMYDSPLFKRKHPRSEGSQYSKGVKSKEDEMDETQKAILMLEKFSKASMSSGRETFPSEIQAKREHGHSFARYSQGVSGSSTPDLPDRGRDWHGTVPGVPDEPQTIGKDEQKEDEEAFLDPKPLFGEKAKSIHDSAMKSLEDVPYFDVEQVIPPREIDFLVKSGFAEDVVVAGDAPMTPILRSQFNKILLSSVQRAMHVFKTKVQD